MENREYKKHRIALRDRAMMMTIDGLQASIKADFEAPAWPSVLFDAMNDALERKMGKRAYTVWFNALGETEVTQ